MPSGDQPGQVAGHGPWCDEEEESGSNNRPRLSHQTVAVQPLLRSVNRKNRDCFATGSASALSDAICVCERGVNSRAICTFSSSWAMLSQPTITVLTGCESVKRIASRIFMTPGRVAIAEPSQECCCCSSGGGVQLA